MVGLFAVSNLLETLTKADHRSRGLDSLLFNVAEDKLRAFRRMT
jgi:hypothetical protein